MSSCLGRAAVPAKRVWRGLAARLGLRRGTAGKPSSTYVPMNRAEAEADMDVSAPDAGLGRLRKEVRTCEYRDVHVMWDMLSNSTAGAGGRHMAAGTLKAAATRKAAAWSRLVSYCCAL